MLRARFLLAWVFAILCMAYFELVRSILLKDARENSVLMLEVDRSALFSSAVPFEIILVKQEELDEAIAFYGSFFGLKDRTAHSADFLLPDYKRLFRVETSLDESMPTSLSITVKDLPALVDAFSEVFALDEISLQLQDDVYYVEQRDPFDVTWQMSWPLEYAPLHQVRDFAQKQKIFIERRLPKMPTQWGHMAHWAASCEEFDVKFYEKEWGLPQFEEYDASETSSMPHYHWWHFLADGTLAFFKCDVEAKSCLLFIDPGEPERALEELNLAVEDWEMNQELELHFVQDDHGETMGVWRFFRQDASGNIFSIKKDLTEYEAHRWVQIYEARKHKEFYGCALMKDDL